MEQRLITESGRRRAEGIKEAGRAQAQAALAPYQAIGGLAKAGAEAYGDYQTKSEERARREEEKTARDERLAMERRRLDLAEETQREQLAGLKREEGRQIEDRATAKAEKATGGRRQMATNILLKAFQTGKGLEEAQQELGQIQGLTKADVDAALQTASQQATTAGIVGQQYKQTLPGYRSKEQVVEQTKEAGAKLALLKEQIDQYEAIEKSGVVPAWMYETGEQQKIKERMAGMLAQLPGGQPYAEEITGMPMELHTSIGKMKEAMNAISGNMLAEIRAGATGLTSEWQEDQGLQTALANIQNISGKNLQGEAYQMFPGRPAADAKRNTAPRAQSFMQWAGIGAGQPQASPQDDQNRVVKTSFLRGQ